MNLFEIDSEIDNCLDPETGEFDEEKFERLQKERDDTIAYLIKKYKNIAADVEALKTQEAIFSERRKREERNAESLKNYLTRALNGKKFKTAEVEVGFRKSKSVIFSDDFTEWAQQNDRDDLLSFKAPTVNKTAVKAALEAGEQIPAEIVENLNISIK